MLRGYHCLIALSSLRIICHVTWAQEALLNVESTQRAMLAANYMVSGFVYCFLSTEWFIVCINSVSLVQWHCTAIFFSQQNTCAMALSSPRSPVTAFSQWAATIRRCLLIAKPRGTHLHIIGEWMCHQCRQSQSKLLCVWAATHFLIDLSLLE